MLKELYVKIKGIPYGTQLVEYDSKKFIIKKREKVNDQHLIWDVNGLNINLERIKKYGNIIEPVEVSKCNFSNRYVIRGNVLGYYALKQNNIKMIPIKVIA